MAYLYLVIAFSLNGVANILLKLGAERGLAFASSPVLAITDNWQFLLGLFLFASNALFYFLALRALPLSTAYPVMVAMSFLIVNAYALFAIHEPIGIFQYVGYVLIVTGLSLAVAPVA